MKNYISIEGNQFDLPDELVNKIRGELTQPKAKTCDDVYRALFNRKKFFFVTDRGIVDEMRDTDSGYDTDAVNCTSEKQAQKLIAINKLMNVAKYLNRKWVPDWNSIENKWKIIVRSGVLDTEYNYLNIESVFYFRTKELAEQAIDILGEETIRLALSTDW